MKYQKKGLSLLIALVMIAATVSPVLAQGEVAPTDEPTIVEESNSFVDHPIVRLLSNFFNSLFTSPVAEEPGGGAADTPAPTDEPGTGDGEPVVEPTLVPTLVPTLSPEEQVAALHTDDDLGFGEITKLLEIAKEAQEECSASGTNCDVTVDSLVTEYKAGTGMGELFAEYGKPEITGVGQVRNGDKEKSNNGKARGKDK